MQLPAKAVCDDKAQNNDAGKNQVKNRLIILIFFYINIIINIGKNNFNCIKKFLKINDLRLQRTRESISQRQVDFLKILPLLFHINHPLLPGYTSSQCPTGIPLYNPDREALHCARIISKSFEHKHRAYQKFDIYALYMMGSTGTIAYSEKSDFDIWLCHREDLSPEAVKEL